MTTRRHTLTVAMTIAVIGLASGGAQAATLFTEDFQTSPLLGNGTSLSTLSPNPFPGWTYSSTSVKSRRSDNQGDLPTGTTIPNQAVQLEWTSAEASYTVSSPTWNAGDVFTLTMDVAPQSWNGTQDRYIAPSLTQGSASWSTSQLMDKYPTSGGPVWEQVQFFAPTTGFTSGSDVTLKIDHTGQRGIYFDNVNLEVGPPPADNDPPTPDPVTWAMAPTVYDYTSVIMSVNPVSDPNDVEYLFTNTDTGNNSGWQPGPQWSEGGLDQNTSYNYTAVARDKSPNQNATGPATDAATTGGLDGLIFSSGFEYPDYSDGTSNPKFYGWDLPGSNVFFSQDAPGDGVPGTVPNQVVQFAWTGNTAATRDTSHAWAADDVYELSLNAAPQNWGEGNQRYFEVSLLEVGGTVLWGSGDVAIPLYNDDWGGKPWPAECTFSYEIPASAFTTGTPGELLSVRITHSGSRGMFFDNVLLRLLAQEGSLHIFKFHDLDGDGEWDDNEPILDPGSALFDIFNEAGDLVGTFPNSEEIDLPAGLYTGVELMDSLAGDWYPSSANPFEFEITGGQLTEVYFGNRVPEPATMALLGLAACGLGGYVRRRRKA